MSTVERLLKATEEIWAGYHEKPFVRGLGDGTLDVKKFRRYIIQDYWYLMDYTKVFAVGVAKSKSVEVMKLFAKYIQAILDGEVNVHNGYMADFGITQEELADAQDQIDALNDQLAQQEEDAAQVEKKIDALLGLYTLQQQYSAGDYDACRRTLQNMTEQGLQDYLPTDSVNDVTSPAQRFEQLNEAVLNH